MPGVFIVVCSNVACPLNLSQGKNWGIRALCIKQYSHAALAYSSISTCHVFTFWATWYPRQWVLSSSCDLTYHTFGPFLLALLVSSSLDFFHKILELVCYSASLGFLHWFLLVGFAGVYLSESLAHKYKALIFGDKDLLPAEIQLKFHIPDNLIVCKWRWWLCISSY